MISKNFVCINDFKEHGSKILTHDALCYFNSGADMEQTLLENENAYKRWKFRPKIFRDVSKIDGTVKVFGSTIPFPICVAPTGMSKLAHVDGEIAVAKAVSEIGTGYTLSCWSTTSCREIAECVPSVIRWLQIHKFKDKTFTESLVQSAETNGFTGIVLTTDCPVFGKRYSTEKLDFKLPNNLRLENFTKEAYGQLNEAETFLNTVMYYPSVTWKDYLWLKSITYLPIYLKGLLTKEMALEAVSHGVDGIIVSNHGGRQLDSVAATIDALPEIVNAVNGRCDVFLDGGIRRGSDVVKAIALGAKAVFVGRPIIWGLACAGKDGVTEVLKILQQEFVQTMQLLGISSIEELQSTKNVVVHESKLSRI